MPRVTMQSYCNAALAHCGPVAPNRTIAMRVAHTVGQAYAGHGGQPPQIPAQYAALYLAYYKAPTPANLARVLRHALPYVNHYIKQVYFTPI